MTLTSKLLPHQIRPKMCTVGWWCCTKILVIMIDYPVPVHSFQSLRCTVTESVDNYFCIMQKLQCLGNIYFLIRSIILLNLPPYSDDWEVTWNLKWILFHILSLQLHHLWFPLPQASGFQLHQVILNLPYNLYLLWHHLLCSG